MKICNKCKQQKHRTEYYLLHKFCKDCAIKASNERYQRLKKADPDWLKYRGIANRYKLTKEQHQELVSKGCGICGTHEGTLVIDHDHSCCPTERCCGKCVRGVLCKNCNLVLGRSKDSQEILQRAINYLNEWTYE